MPDPKRTVAAVILAAGTSTRLGRPKQMLLYNGKTLFEHAFEAAFTASCTPVIAITGEWFTSATFHVPDNLLLLRNHHAESGMASSIKMGVNAVSELDEVSGVLFLLCDQPLITPKHLKNLINEFLAAEEKKIAATHYAGISGVPALFPKDFFKELMQLKGDDGARKIIHTHQSNIITVPCEDAAVDIDTKEAYRVLLSGDK